MEGRAASVPDHDPETSEVHILDGLDAMLSRFYPRRYFARDIRPLQKSSGVAILGPELGDALCNCFVRSLCG